MGQFVKENAHLKTDMKKYGENYDHIFNKNKDKNICQECCCDFTPKCSEDEVCDPCLDHIYKDKNEQRT